MKLGRLVAILLVVSFVMFPVAAKAQTVAPTPLMPVIPEAEVQDVINKYVDRFKTMDHEGLMSLFAKEAVENRMLPYNDLSASYRKAFSVTNQFIYHLKIDSIHTYTKSAIVTGRYQIIQTLKEKDGMRIYKGNIQWELVPEDGSLKIIRLNYGNEMRDG